MQPDTIFYVLLLIHIPSLSNSSPYIFSSCDPNVLFSQTLLRDLKSTFLKLNASSYLPSHFSSTLYHSPIRFNFSKCTSNHLVYWPSQYSDLIFDSPTSHHCLRSNSYLVLSHLPLTTCLLPHSHCPHSGYNCLLLPSPFHLKPAFPA